MTKEEIKQRNESKEFLKDLQYYLFQNKRSPKIDNLSILLDNDEKRIEELEKENKTVSRKANEAIADKLLITAKYNEVLNDLNQENDKLQKENADLKCECRTCVYTDSPCVCSDYPSKDGACSHYKNVFDENTKLREQHRVDLVQTQAILNQRSIQNTKLTKAKEIIREFMKYEITEYDGSLEIHFEELKKQAEQFLSEVEK